MRRHCSEIRNIRCKRVRDGVPHRSIGNRMALQCLFRSSFRSQCVSFLSELAYIIALAEKVRLQQIADHSGCEESDALRLGNWTVASDLARLLEVEAKLRYRTNGGAAAPGTIVLCSKQGFNRTAFGDLSDIMNNTIRPMFPRKPIPMAAQLHENSFDGMLTHIRDTNVHINERVAAALYLLAFTRNQAAHRIDTNLKLFQQLDDAKFLVDLFLTLCRTKAWQRV